MLPRIQPMRLRLIKQAFDDPEYLFELKHDGFRGLVYLQDGDSSLVSRNLKNLRFDSLKKSLAELPVKNAILDGEIICIDGKGVSQFNRLLSRKAEPIFYAFDLLWLNDEDLRRLPLIVRKKRLFDLIRSTDSSRIMYAQHVETLGKLFFEEICARDLEGIVAKPKLSIYKDGGNSWLKIKNRNYSPAKGRHELLMKLCLAKIKSTFEINNIKKRIPRAWLDCQEPIPRHMLKHYEMLSFPGNS